MALLQTGSTSVDPDVNEQRALIAHALRRCTFGPFPGRVEELVDEGRSFDELIESLGDSGPLPFDPPGDIDGSFDSETKALEFENLVRWWIERMRSDDAALHERMMWFWHTHFTTSSDKANGMMCWRQLRLLHTHALGNFRDLTRAITTDAAMLQYLDGEGSVATAPNENYARELMELFTLGRNQYTQADVQAASKALAGWGLDWESGKVDERPEARMRWPVVLFGETGMFTAEGVVDQVLAQDACAPFIVGKLWDSFVGGPRNDELIEQWAAEFRSSDYEILPLMKMMLRSDAFRETRMSRTRSTLEWFIPMMRSLGRDDYTPWDLEHLGQQPFRPPNVAGWPTSRWTSSSTMLARAGYVSWFDVANPKTIAAIGAQVAAADAALRHCSLFEVSDSTLDALRRLHGSLARDGLEDVDIGLGLLRAIVLSPEFSLA